MDSVGSIFFGAFAFGIGFDLATTAWWDSHNKGVSFSTLKASFPLGIFLRGGLSFFSPFLLVKEIRQGRDWILGTISDIV